MVVKITGKSKAIEELERAENLIREAHDGPMSRFSTS